MAWVNIVGSENRLKRSQDQSSMVWQELGGVVKTANVVAGPDGSISGGKVAFAGATNSALMQAGNGAMVSGKDYTWSLWVKGVVGGEKNYDNMLQWATQNLREGEIKMYDKVMEQGNPLAAYFAVQALAYRYQEASGKLGEMVTGKAPKESGNVFKSQAQVVEAMSDPKYDQDPAYRQEIQQKLARSNIEF